MNSFELNKIFGAILGTLVFVMGVGFLAEEIYAPIEDRGADYLLPEPEVGGEGEVAQVAQVAPISVRMQDASAADGEAIVVRCQSCHDYSESNENRVGPGLWGIVGRDIANHPDFSYSDALLELAEAEGTWSYQQLDGFIENPQEHAPGTSMSFGGLDDPMDRANLFAFLREQADEPAPLPEVTEEDRIAMEGGGEDADAGAEGDADAANAGFDYAPLIAEADLEFGASIAARCQGCHDFSENEEIRVGPPLYGVVERAIAAVDDFDYSEALETLGAEGEVWTFANLDSFIEDPDGYAPGTNMSFPGLADQEERIALLAWMREQAADPVALDTEALDQTEEALEEGPAQDQAVEEGAAEDDMVQEAPSDAPAMQEDDAAAPAESEASGAPAPDAETEAPAQGLAAPQALSEAGDDAQASEESDGQAPAQDTDAAPAEQEPMQTEPVPQGADAAMQSTDADAPAVGQDEANAEIAEMIAAADPEAGASAAAVCQGCHDVSEDNAPRVGPGLYGVVGREIAALDDFDYSEALASLGAQGEVWDYANLDAFLEAPAEYAPGTTMGFAGIEDDAERHNVIAWLRLQADEPAPLPDIGAEGEGEDSLQTPDQNVPASVGAEDDAQSDAPVVELDTVQNAPNQPITDVPGAGQTGGEQAEGNAPLDDLPARGAETVQEN